MRTMRPLARVGASPLSARRTVKPHQHQHQPVEQPSILPSTHIHHQSKVIWSGIERRSDPRLLVPGMEGRLPENTGMTAWRLLSFANFSAESCPSAFLSLLTAPARPHFFKKEECHRAKTKAELRGMVMMREMRSSTGSLSLLPIESETACAAARMRKPAGRLDSFSHSPIASGLSPSSSPSGTENRSRPGSTCGWAVSWVARRLCNSPLRSPKEWPQRRPDHVHAFCPARRCGLALAPFSAHPFWSSLVVLLPCPLIAHFPRLHSAPPGA
jgi:hypothetical protein